MDLMALHSIMNKNGFHYFEGLTNNEDNDLYMSFSTKYNGRGNVIDVRIGETDNDINFSLNEICKEHKKVSVNEFFRLLKNYIIGDDLLIEFDSTAVPKVNEKYNYFDDGKITSNRKYVVTITDVIHYHDIDNDTMFNWKCEVKAHRSLFANKTDYFVKATIDDEDEELIFVRDKNGGWFSFNNFLWDGSLDIDGSLTSKLKY